MTYLAKCPDTDCTTADPTALDWFKIDEAGLNSDGTWASDTLIANNNTWTVTIPSDIASGPYLMRHELLALHAAENTNGAQFYPMCANLIVTGSGSAVPSDTIKFPGGYTSSDPGILINIYYPVPTSYTIPGPAVYVPGGASASTSVAATSVAATTSAAAATSVAATEIAATSEVAATSVAETTPVAAIPTTVLASSTFIGTGFVGTGPASLPTYVPSVRPPFSNSTRTITRSRGPTSSALVDATHTVSVLPVQETDPVDVTTEIVYVTAPAATTAPVTTFTETQTSTIEKTVILTFTASAIETVTVTEHRPECTATGRHRRGTYFV